MFNFLLNAKLLFARAISQLNDMNVFTVLISICLATDVPTNGKTIDDKAANPLYDVVVQSILENCRKLECGVLTWRIEQEVHEQNHVFGTYYTNKMWLDGEKVAINTKSLTFSGKNEENSREKESKFLKAFDGNEFRSRIGDAPVIILSKKPEYIQFENYLKDYGWPGYDNSIVDKLARDINNEEASLEWSIVESNGTEKIMLKKAYNNIADYYELHYFDPAKGCMECKIESYTNNELTYTQSWKLEEVSKGIWFPVECDQYGKIIEKNWTYTTKISVDLENSSFNDRSAIPEGIFTLEITPDIDFIYDYRLGEPPVVYDKRYTEHLAMEELDKAAKEFINEESPATNIEKPDNIIADEKEEQINTIDSNESSPDLLLQVDKNDKKTGLLQILLIGAGIILVTLGIVGWKRTQHSNK